MKTAESQRDSDAGVPGVEDPVDPRPAVRDLLARGRCVLVAQGRGGRRQIQAGQLELHEEDVRGAVRSHHAHGRSSSPLVGADASPSLRCLLPPLLRMAIHTPLVCSSPFGIWSADAFWSLTWPFDERPLSSVGRTRVGPCTKSPLGHQLKHTRRASHYTDPRAQYRLPARPPGRCAAAGSPTFAVLRRPIAVAQPESATRPLVCACTASCTRSRTA